MSSLQAWCHWISIWAHGDGPKEPVNSLVAALVASAVDVFSPTWSSRGVATGNLKENGREKVYQAGLQLLSSVVSVIRTSNLWNCPSWNEIYHSVYDIDYLPPAVCPPFYLIFKMFNKLFNGMMLYSLDSSAIDTLRLGFCHRDVA